MDNLSKIFAGKAFGVKAIEPEINLKTSIGDVEKKMFKEASIKKEGNIGMFNLSTGSSDMKNKIYGINFGNLGIRDKIYGKGSFGGGSIKDKIHGKGSNMNSISAIENKMFNNAVRRPDLVGWNRMKQQKGLTMFGDYDKDGVANVYDCDPYNAKMQGLRHKVLNFISGKGYKENNELPAFKGNYGAPIEETIVKTPVGALNIYGQEKQQSIEPYYDGSGDVQYNESFSPGMSKIKTGMMQIGTGLKGLAIKTGGGIKSAAVKTGGELKAGTSSVLYSAGVFKTPEERQSIAKKKEERDEKILKIKHTKALADYEFAHKLKPQYPAGYYSNPYLYLGDRFYPRKRRPVRRAMDEMQMAMSQSGMSVGGISQAPIQQGSRINQLIGGGIGGGSSMPMISRAYSVVQSPVVRQPVQSVAPQGIVYSPYSKRPVTYTRGPYNKQQYQQQQ